MKKFLFRHKTVLFSCGIVACLVCIALLSASLVSVFAAQNEKLYYPEPDVRPDIRADAYWDSELGMYVSGDYRKNASGVYVLNRDNAGSLSDEVIQSPEQKWLKEHAESENEIDRAILASVARAMNEPPTLLSSFSPRDSDAIRESMSCLSVSSYPELWERICTEPAYRAQKIVAMENFLNISFDDLGLYDATAQKQWYDSFMALKTELASKDSAVTVQDAEKYGNLLLPMLARKADTATLSDAEQAVLASLTDGIAEKGFVASASQGALHSENDISVWASDGAELIAVIDEILSQNWEWVS